MPSDDYGLLVTILALLNVVPATLGNVLNNIRLLHETDYQEKNVHGDFNLLLIISEAANIIIVGIFVVAYSGNIVFIDVLLTTCVAVVWLLREYFIVAFRLIINYKAILLNNIIMVIGYGVGYGLFLIFGQWQIIYLSGYCFSLAYIIVHCSLWKEPIQKTELFKMITSESTMLLVAGLLTRVIIYADKLLIYPILGGTMVAIYYAATIFGKVVSLVVNPVSSVALTYLSKRKSKDNKMFSYTLLIGFVVCLVGYIACIIISKPLLKILYPDFVDEAMHYILLTTGVAVLTAWISLINPFIMKFFSMKWQIAINGGTAAIYVILSMTLLHFWGLYGFCIGALMTYILKLLLMIAIYYKCRPLEEERL